MKNNYESENLKILENEKITENKIFFNIKEPDTYYLSMQIHIVLATIFNNCVVVHCFSSLTVDNSVKEDY